MITYEFWRHSRSGQVFAVQLLDGIVVACSGPLHHDDIDLAFLADLDYSEEGATVIEASRDEYVLVEAA
jgi:hypothetical protein